MIISEMWYTLTMPERCSELKKMPEKQKKTIQRKLFERFKLQERGTIIWSGKNGLLGFSEADVKTEEK